MLLLLCLLPLVNPNPSVAQPPKHLNKLDQADVATTTRPLIYFCRSPNMEDFSCWWHPITNPGEAQEATYVLTYSIDNGPRHECPDYKTSGANSCHFDRSHTTVWNVYCMNVVAVTVRGNYTSQQHCLDVADIVQMEAPVNLTYELVDVGGDEVGHSSQLSWSYPVPSDLQYGWITLLYELQYRRVGETNNWKVKSSLREPHVELIGLPFSDYVVRVRCRSTKSVHWSNWSATLLMSVPARQPTGNFLALILVLSIGVIALLVVIFGIVPQSKRIKDFFLPPIPKPRIFGIDPRLLKKGHFDEINNHLSSFHGYRQPSYTEEVWDCVSAGDDVFLKIPNNFQGSSDPVYLEVDALIGACDGTPAADTQQLLAQNSYAPSMSAYCAAPPEAFTHLKDDASPWPQVISLPGTDYSMMGGAVMSFQEPVSAPPPQQDFYSCVHVIKDGGEVHLVPCLPPPVYCRDDPALTQAELSEKSSKEMRRKAGAENGENTSQGLDTGNPQDCFEG